MNIHKAKLPEESSTAMAPQVPRPSSVTAKMRLNLRISLGHHGRSITIPKTEVCDGLSLVSGSQLGLSVSTLDTMDKKAKELNDSIIVMSSITEYKQSSTNEVEVDNHLGMTDLASKRSILMKGISSNVSLPSANAFRKSRLHQFNQVKFFEHNNQIEVIGEHESKKDDQESVNFYKSHVDINERWVIEGWDSIAGSIASGASEFFYLEPHINNPYKFRITGVPVSLNSGIYATLSKHGLVRVIDGESTDIITLSQFYRECQIYYKIINIGVFANYMKWKSIYIWRQDIKRGRLLKRCTELKPKMVLLEPSLRQLLLHTLKQCDQIQCIYLIQIYVDQSFLINRYITEQQKIQCHAIECRKNIMNNIIKYLLEFGESVTANAVQNMPDTMSLKKYNLYKEAGGNVPPLPKLNSESSPNYNVGLIKNEEMPLSYTERASIRVSCRRLASVFRLADFCIRDTYYSSLENSLTELYKYITKENVLKRDAGEISSLHYYKDARNSDSKYFAKHENPKLLITRSAAMFTISVNVNEKETASGISFLVGRGTSIGGSAIHVYVIEPTANNVISSFYNFLLETLNLGVFTSTMFSDSSLAALMIPIRNEISSILLEDRVHLDRSCSVFTVVSNIIKVLENDFENCFKLLQSAKCSKLLHQYTNNTIFLSTYTLETVVNNGVDDIKVQLDRLLEESKECNELVDFEDVGIVRLDFLAVRNVTLNCINSCKSLLNQIIPEWYLQCGEMLYNQVFQIISSLGTKPNNLDDFVKMLEIYNLNLLSSDNIRASYEIIMAIREIIEDYQIPLSDSILRQNLSITNVWYQYTDILVDFGDAIESYTKDFVRELLARIKTTKQPLDEAREYIVNEVVLNPSSDPHEVISAIKKYIYKLEFVKIKSFEYNRCQNILKVTVFEMKPVINLYEQLNVALSLWTQIENITDINSQVYASTIMSCSCAEIVKRVSIANGVITSITISGNTNSAMKSAIDNYSRLITYIKDKLADLEVTVSSLTKLQSKSLRIRHIDELHHLFDGWNFFDKPETMVSELCRRKNSSIALTEIIKEDVFPECKNDDVDVLQADNEPIAENSASNDKNVNYLIALNSAITEIFNRSFCEHNIETNINSIRIKCLAQIFQFTSDKENKSLFFISNIHDLEIFFDDALVDVQSILQSSYCMIHLTNAIALKNDVLHWCDLLKKLKLMQIKYLQARVIFTSARTARHLHPFLKYFKTVDDIWREILLICKAESLVTKIFSAPSIPAQLDNGAFAIEKTDQSVTQYIEMQYSKWPKLYLLSKDSLIEILGTQDTRKTFIKCRAVMPSISDVTFDKSDLYSTVAVWSGFEQIKLHKPSSARNSLVDWLRNIDTCLSERIIQDIRQYTDEGKTIVDDLRQPFSIEQGRICAMQIKFTDSFTKCLMINDFTSLMNELNETIATVAKLPINASTRYQRVSISNILTLLLCNRDTVCEVKNSMNTHSVASSPQFIFDLLIKKIWDYSHNQIKIKHGMLRLTYGMKYQGFTNHRLVITPLSTRCLYAINVALQPRGNCKIGSMPILTAPDGHNKQSMLSFLASELGVEMINMDLVNCSLNSIELMYIVKATVEAGLWLNLLEIGRVKPELFSILLTVLTAVYEKMATATDNIVEIGGFKMEINLNQMTCEPSFRVACTFDPKVCNFFFPSSIQSIFRPITIIEPNICAILRVVLNIYCSTGVEKLALKLERLLYFFVSTKNCSRVNTFPSLIKAIHNVGCYIYDTRKVDQIATAEFLQQAVKEFLKILPASVLLGLKDNDYLYIFEIVLDISYSNKAKSDYNSVPPNASSIYYVDLLASYLTQEISSIQQGNWSVSSVVVLGSNACGKSIIIDKSIFKGIQAYNGSNTKSRIPIPLVTACVSDQLYQLQNKFMSRYPYTINPYVLVTKDEVKFDNMLPIHDEATYVMESIIKSIDSNGPIQVIHMDIFSSLQYVSVADYCHKMAKTLLKPVTFVWEMVELYHADPYSLSNVQGIVHIPSEGIFNQNDVINFCMSNLFNSPDVTECEVFQLRDMIKFCVNEYLEPCLLNCARDTVLPQHVLIDNTFKLFRLVYKSSQTNEDVNSPNSFDNNYFATVVWTEQTIQRIFVFSCIWTFGMCSATSRISFETWFRSYFDDLIVKSQVKNENKAVVDSNIESITNTTADTTSVQMLWSKLSDNTITEQIYIVKPLLNVNTSIFDYFLTKENIFDDEISGGSLLFCTSNPLLLANENVSSLRMHKATIPKHFQSSIYSNHHIESSVGAIDSFQGCALIVPTLTGNVARFLQDCMTKLESHIGGNICIMGQNGSGKGSLIRQLSLMEFQADISVIGENNTWKRRYSSTIPYRWTSRFKDCNAAYIQYIITSCIRKSSPFLLERNLPSYGTIIIEDVNYSVDDINEVGSNNASEWLRYTSTYMHHYNVGENRWGSYDGLFLLSNAISTSKSQMNTRLLRQSLVIHTAESELSSVFCTLLNATFPVLSASGVADDVVIITFKLFDLLKEKYNSIRTSTTEFTTNNIDSICYDHLKLMSLASIVDNIIAITSNSLSSLNLFTSNDLVRVWDRVSSDYFSNFNGFENIFNQSVNDALDACIFKYPSFSDLVKRERIKRFDQSAKLIQAVENSDNDYKDVQFTTGFYKNSDSVFIALQSVDYFRDNNVFITTSPLYASQFVYMDIQRIATMLSLKYPNRHLFVLNSNETYKSTSYVIETACKCIHASYYFVRLSDDETSWQLMYDLIIDSFIHDTIKLKIELHIDDNIARKVQTWEKLNCIFDLSELYIITSINRRYGNDNNIDVRIDPVYRSKYVNFLNNFSCVITYTSNLSASAAVFALSSCPHIASKINMVHIFNNNATISVMKALGNLKTGVAPNYNELLPIIDDVTKFIEKSCNVYHNALGIRNIGGGIIFNISSLSYKVGTMKMMYALFRKCSREPTANDFFMSIYMSLYVRYVLLLNESVHYVFCEFITTAISKAFNIQFTPVNATDYLKAYLLSSDSIEPDVAVLFKQFIRFLPENSRLRHLLEVVCIHYIVCDTFCDNMCQIRDYSCLTMTVLTPLFHPVLQQRSYDNFYLNFNKENESCLHYVLRNKKFNNDLEKISTETTVILIEPTMSIISDYILMILLMEKHTINNYINTSTNLSALYQSINNEFHGRDCDVSTVYDLSNSNNDLATRFIACWINISSTFSISLKTAKYLLDSISLQDYNLMNSIWGSIISCLKLFLERNDLIKEVDKNITFLTSFKAALVVCIKDTLPKYFAEPELIFILFVTVLKLFYANTGESGINGINKLLGILLEMGEAHGFSLSGLTQQSSDDCDDEDNEVDNRNYVNADLTSATKYSLNKVLIHTRKLLHSHTDADINYDSGLFKAVESDKYAWMSWAANPEDDVDFPSLAHSFSLSWIDKIAIAYFLKPLIFPKVLIDAVVHIGIGISTNISKIILEKYYSVLAESTQKNVYKFQIVRNHHLNNEYKLLNDNSNVNCNKIIFSSGVNRLQLNSLINFIQRKEVASVLPTEQETNGNNVQEISATDMLLENKTENHEINMYHIIEVLPTSNSNRYVYFDEICDYSLFETNRVLFQNSLDKSVSITHQIPMSALEMSHINSTISFHVTNKRAKFMSSINTGLELLRRNPSRHTSDETISYITTRIQMLFIFLHSAVSIRFEGTHNMCNDMFIQLLQYIDSMVTTTFNEAPNKVAVSMTLEANYIINSIFGSIYSTIITQPIDMMCVKAMMRNVIKNHGLNYSDKYEFENYTIFETIKVPYVHDNENVFLTDIDNALEDSDNGIPVMLKVLGLCSNSALHNQMFGVIKSTFVSIRVNADLIKHGIVGINMNYSNDQVDKSHHTSATDQTFPLYIFKNNHYELKTVIYPRLQLLIRKLQSRIPLVIDTTSEVIVTSKRRNSSIGLSPSATAPPADRLNKVMSSMKRKAKDVKSKLGTHHSIDPLWEYISGQCLSFNDYITSINNYFKYILSFSIDRCKINDNMFNNIINIIKSLDNLFIPSIWLDNNAQITVDNWIYFIGARRSFIFEWMEKGFPCHINLSLLHDPKGLIDTLKESYSYRTSSPIDNMHLCFRIRTQLNELPSPAQLIAMNNGCTLICTDFGVYNSQISNNGFEYISPVSTNPRTAIVAIEIYIRTEIEHIRVEDYQCPIYVDNNIKKYSGNFFTNNISHYQYFNNSRYTLISSENSEEKVLIGYVSLTTTAGDELIMSKANLHCSFI